MLTFLRKIRRSLIESGSARKYLLYAIGEVLLVMIGILLAIQINEYRTNRNTRSEEIRFLQFVKQDLERDIKNLKDVSNFKKMQLDNSKEIIKFYKHSEESIQDTLDFVDKIVSTFYVMDNNPNNTAFETAKISGGIQKYQNEILINSLSTYYSDNEMKLHLGETRKYINFWASNVFFSRYYGIARSLYLSGGNSSEFMSIYEDDPRGTVTWIPDFRKDLQMENYFGGMLVRLQIGIGYLDKREMQATSLVISIDEYINSIQ